MITNPTPIQAAIFAGMWITNICIMLPHGTHRGLIDAKLMPYDGDKHLLATGGKDARINIPNPKIDSMVANVVEEVQRQADTDRVVRMIHVNAPDPSKPVTALVMFVEGRPHFIPDCFALAATDATFAQVLEATMAAIADVAGLEVV